MNSIERAIVVGLILACAVSARGVSVDWIRQYGTTSNEYSYSVSADGLGNVYASGTTAGALGGANAGYNDAYLRKYDSNGNTVWTRQLGTSQFEEGRSVSADALGHIYIGGGTGGNLAGTSAGDYDAFVAQYNSAGSLIWVRQFGSPFTDDLSSVSADGLGNVYAVGDTCCDVVPGGHVGPSDIYHNDIYIRKYDSAGNALWTRQFGSTDDDHVFTVSADALGGVYIGGLTSGVMFTPNAGDRDAFLVKYDANGNFQWGRQFGSTTTDVINGLATDNLGNVYAAGSGIINSGSTDRFLRKYNSAGNVIWTNLISGLTDYQSVSADRLGDVYVSGETYESLNGPIVGDSDAYVSKFDSAGNYYWTRQYGSAVYDIALGVSTDGLGNVYAGGWTYGSLGGPNHQSADGFVLKIVDPTVVPEPSTFALAVICVPVLFRGRARRSNS